MSTTTTTTSAVSVSATAANSAAWGNPANPAGASVQANAIRSSLGKAIAPRLQNGIAYAQVSAAVTALQNNRTAPENSIAALDAFCGQVRAILNKLVQKHTVCTVYNYLQDRATGKYSRAQVREAIADYMPVYGLQDSIHLRGILANPVVAQRVGLQLVVDNYNAGGRARTSFVPYFPVFPHIPQDATTEMLKTASKDKASKGKRK